MNYVSRNNYDITYYVQSSKELFTEKSIASTLVAIYTHKLYIPTNCMLPQFIWIIFSIIILKDVTLTV